MRARKDRKGSGSRQARRWARRLRIPCILLPLAGAGAIYLRHRHLPKEVAPGSFVTVDLWATAVGMVAIAFYSVWLVIRWAWKLRSKPWAS